jgi:hypothetical protein
MPGDLFNGMDERRGLGLAGVLRQLLEGEGSEKSAGPGTEVLGRNLLAANFAQIRVYL